MNIRSTILVFFLALGCALPNARDPMRIREQAACSALPEAARQSSYLFDDVAVDGTFKRAVRVGPKHMVDLPRGVVMRKPAQAGASGVHLQRVLDCQIAEFELARSTLGMEEVRGGGEPHPFFVSGVRGDVREGRGEHIITLEVGDTESARKLVQKVEASVASRGTR
jgi:hypothetical protein